jgi:cation diffusion facilitator CzcD-associated flavoprotein CzcO
MEPRDAQHQMHSQDGRVALNSHDGRSQNRDERQPDHVDVLIVGAGLSGIGAACHLTRSCPSKSYAILEARDAIGGTWDMFRYPGIRSDSDMYTLGYSFRPWLGDKSMADGPSILEYVKSTAREYDVERHIRFGHKVIGAEWSTPDAAWTVSVEHKHTEERTQITCSFLFLCTGYYNYTAPYTPNFAGAERFQGPIVHPQHWDEQLDYAGKRVVVIGSGSTAITLVPALAQKARHVTMLQRSPTYIISLPESDAIARTLGRVLPAKKTYAAIRLKNVLLQLVTFQLSRRYPEKARQVLRRLIERQLPAGVDSSHFRPRYNPWDQRLCVAADADLFKAIRAGKASVVTARVQSFTEKGVVIDTGEELEADVVVTATGLNLLPVGGARLTVDGRDVELPKTMGYKGMMLSDVPNLAMVLGYTNASWTLKCDLTCAYVCRLLNHMEKHGYDTCTPRRDPSVKERPFIDLTSGYIQRSLKDLPTQGDKPPWRLYQNWFRDLIALRLGAIEDGAMQFSRAGAKEERPHEPRLQPV